MDVLEEELTQNQKHNQTTTNQPLTSQPTHQTTTNKPTNEPTSSDQPTHPTATNQPLKNWMTHTCYTWSANDTQAISQLGSTSSAKRSVCESLGHVFAKGTLDAAQQHGKVFFPHIYIILKVLCLVSSASVIDFKGNADLAPGCGTCWCCQKAGIQTSQQLSFSHRHSLVSARWRACVSNCHQDRQCPR